MVPNWSRLEALGRVLLVLFASTFCGALVLPLAADGHLPVTWELWRAPLATATSASIVAEFVWIRSHLSAAAGALGLPSPALAARALARSFPPVATVLLVVCLCRCTPAQAASDVVIGVQAVACGLDHYSQDTAAGDTDAQIVADIEKSCGLTPDQWATVLAAHTKAEQAEKARAR